MDDSLFQRFLSGDPLAATGVRNHLRAVAHRVLAAPQWEMPDSDIRRERESAAVAEILQSPGHSMVQAASMVMAVSLRTGLEQLRTAQGIPQGHIPTDLLARRAIDKLNDDEKEQVRSHLEGCPTCSRHLEVARSALKAATSSQKADPPIVASATRTPVPSNKRPTSTRTAKKDKPTKSAGVGHSEWVTQGVILLGLFYLVFHFTRPNHQELTERATQTRSEMLPTELPPTALAGTFESSIEVNIQLMSSGRCANSAIRLSRFLERDPENRLLRYYYSLALLCDRQAKNAMESFGILHQMEGDRFWGEQWWRAQALYLNGSDEKAMLLLDKISESQHGRAADAEALLKRIIAVN
jgi:hypothetical protein